MRYDLNVLWVEDMPVFYEETKDILEMFAEDKGVTIKFDYISDASEFYKRIGNDATGFKKYDMFFVDYTLSDNVLGTSVIKDLRKEKMDSDVLFYSSEREGDIEDTVKQDLSSFGGVYIANRDNFEEKSNYLINKNARRLTSLSSIRGFLMDQTSENDYTIQSYILRKFDELEPEEKKQISDMLLQFIVNKKSEFDEHAESQIKSLEENGITNINKTMKLMSELFPITLKYEMFEKMLEFLGENAFEEFSLQRYTAEIIKARNTLAHKKLDICKTQEYILYYDTINQYQNRQCPSTCDEHTDDYKYSTSQWNEIRKNTLIFGKEIDELQKKL